MQVFVVGTAFGTAAGASIGGGAGASVGATVALPLMIMTIIWCIFAFILNAIYIYFWIVVNSLRKSVIEERLMVLPTQ